MRWGDWGWERTVVGGTERAREPGAGRCCWRWRRKWTIIHNTASLKTAMRLSLLVSLLIARYSFYMFHTWVFALGETLQRLGCLWEASTINLPHMFSYLCWTQQVCFQVCPISCRLRLKRASFFKTWGSCRWPGKATADTWAYQRSWRCEPGMTWCWSVPPAHPNPLPTFGIKTWECFCCCKPVNTCLLLYELLPSLALHFSPLNFPQASLFNFQ